MALKHVHDPGVVDLALADAHLKLAGGRSGIAQVHVLDVGKNAVEIDVGLRALKVMAGVQGDAPSPGRPGTARRRPEGRRSGVSECVSRAEHQAFAEGVGPSRAEPLDFVVDRRAARRGMQGDHGDTE